MFGVKPPRTSGEYPFTPVTDCIPYSNCSALTFNAVIHSSHSLVRVRSEKDTVTGETRSKSREALL